MGLPSPLINFFLKENQHRLINGKILTLGRQTILCSPKNLNRKLKDFNLKWNPSQAEIDTSTTFSNNSKNDFVSDRSFFESFGVKNIDVLDVTNYEGANIIHDMSMPVPEKYKNKWDFIFNGSILDNMFDPAQAMRNISEMLSESGRVLHIEMASNLAFEYLMFSVDWFFDYYIVNNYKDCMVYVCGFKDVDSLCYGPWRVFSYKPKTDGTAFSLKSLNLEQAVIIVLAEKKKDSSSLKTAVQWCYRNNEMKNEFNTRLKFIKSTRPIYRFGDHKNLPREEYNGDGFCECGVIEKVS